MRKVHENMRIISVSSNVIANNTAEQKYIQTKIYGLIKKIPLFGEILYMRLSADLQRKENIIAYIEGTLDKMMIYPFKKKESFLIKQWCKITGYQFPYVSETEIYRGEGTRLDLSTKDYIKYYFRELLGYQTK